MPKKAMPQKSQAEIDQINHERDQINEMRAKAMLHIQCAEILLEDSGSATGADMVRDLRAALKDSGCDEYKT